MVIRLAVLCMVLVLVTACVARDDDDPPCEECPPCPECPEPEPEPEPEPPECDFEVLKESCEFGVLRLKCECAPNPDLPKPEDYVLVSNVESLLFWQSHKWEGLYAYEQAIIWQGSRDIFKVLDRCEWSFPVVFKVSKDWVKRFAERGADLNSETRRFIRNMWKRNFPDKPRDKSGIPIVNQRCSKQPKFCEVTNIRKLVWKDFRSRLLAHMDRSSGFRRLARECIWPGMNAYDSITGWCTEINKVGRKSCP